MISRTARLWGDLRAVTRLVQPHRGRVSHKERLDAFYGPQSSHYDHFREALLQGRAALMDALPIMPGSSLIDMGGGTGRNLEFLGERIHQLRSAEIVDLCDPLLAVARRRIGAHRWSNVSVRRADITTYDSGGSLADLISFSYSLTMVPNWFDAVDRAFSILKPGGYIGVVDFYISRKWPEKGCAKHSALSRLLWPAWFSYSNVFLNPDHIEYLRRSFETVRFEERMAKVPYLCGLRAPYYLFIGRKN